jgi:hypothetical protein
MSSQIDYTHMVDEAGMDAIISNTRVRASKVAATVTGTSGGGNNLTFPANPLGINWIDGVGTPIPITTGSAVVLYPGQVLSGIITIKPTASIALTFDTAAMLVAGANQVTAGIQNGDYICFLIINGAALASGFNITPGTSTGVTFDANNAGVIAPATSRYVFMRLANVATGSEAVVVYY